MTPPPALTGDQKTDWALWRLTLLVAEIAATPSRPLPTDADRGQEQALGVVPPASSALPLPHTPAEDDDATRPGTRPRGRRGR